VLYERVERIQVIENETCKFGSCVDLVCEKNYFIIFINIEPASVDIWSNVGA